MRDTRHAIKQFYMRYFMRNHIKLQFVRFVKRARLPYRNKITVPCINKGQYTEIVVSACCVSFDGGFRL